MLFEAFTGSFLGLFLGDARIDTRLFPYNVFYREKTFVRQLFFQEETMHPMDAWVVESRV
ncbi:hypothetical protein [Mesorhizobium caraganae]|jgi:hypothetical protein|uniref:hypothetical protein n=1 Tax=Mesorhizobium caraganae TaxID=483206 RepID=UPI003337DE51